MALVLADRARETTTVTGTGTATLLGAVSGYQSFSAVGNANTTYYVIANQSATEWEVGIGTYTSSGTTLSRTTVLSSSNSGSLVNFSAGTKDVFVDYPASKAVYKDASGNVDGYPITGGTINNTTIGATTPTTGSFTNITGSANAIISVTDNTNAALRITQLGTGNTLLVEDSSNPDATPFVINNAGNVGIGLAPTSAAKANITSTSAGASAIALSLQNASDTINSETVLDFVTNTAGAGIRSAQITAINTNNSTGVNMVFKIANGALPAEAMRIISTGEVGIGATPTTASKALIVNTSAGASAIALSLQNASATINSETVLDFVTNTAGTGIRSAQITAINTNNSTGVNMVFKIANGDPPVEVVRIGSTGTVKMVSGISVGGATPAASGVAFPATAIAVANANTLDDYEEGTWTPVVTFTGGNGDLTTAEAVGVYTKIGRLVQIAFNVEFSETTAATNLTITGVPFTSGGAVRTFVGCWVDNMSMLVGSPIAGLTTGTTTISMNTTGTGGAANITNINTGASSRVRGSLSYSI
jgi:hypothetical protein